MASQTASHSSSPFADTAATTSQTAPGPDGELAAFSAFLEALQQQMTESDWLAALTAVVGERADEVTKSLALAADGTISADSALQMARHAMTSADLGALLASMSSDDRTGLPTQMLAPAPGPRDGALQVAMMMAPTAVLPVMDPVTGNAAVKQGGHAADPYALALAYVPTDTLFGNQWHLNNTGQSGGVAGVDLNLLTIWDEFTGAGVTVGIWDDGVQYTHPDLDDNYNATLHILNGNGSTHDPLPQAAGSAHGTAVAGVIAAENNGTGTVGVAFGADITGVDMFFDPLLFVEQSTSQLDTYDVTNHSWGFTQSFAANILDPDAYWTSFFGGIEESVSTGRGGLGTINLVAAGNDRTIGRDSNDSNFTNLPQTISVAAVGHDGLVSWYSTPGAANLVAGPSNGPAGSGIWTTDRTGADGYSNGANESGNTSADNTNDFGGTSSATPAVAGVVALMLEANPLLGWRDVQDILAMSARHTGTALGAAHSGDELYDWEINGATNWNSGGMHFSNDYGFGLVDAFAAVRLAESWTEQDTVSNWSTVAAQTWTGSTVIPDNTPAGVSFTLTVTDTTELEHVGLNVSFNAASFTGDYLITLTSPSGTISYLSRAQNNGDSFNGDFFLSSNAFRGESGVGTWTVNVSDRWAADIGTLEGLQLEFYGNAASADDIYVFTDEYSTLVGLGFGHGGSAADTNGGIDTYNLAALTSASTVTLGSGAVIDGVVLSAAEIAGIENVIGGDGNDIFVGDGNQNSLSGMRGNDFLSGGGAYDQLYGGAGNDEVSGDAGTDEVFGGDGNDELNGGADYDSVYAGDGNDIVIDTDGVLDEDYYLGGAGIDTVLSNFVWQATHVWDMITGAISNTLLVWEGFENYTHGAAGAAQFTVLGTADTNVIDLGFSTAGVTVDGRGGDDLIYGGSGDDSLAGGGDSDSIYGGDGNDIIRHGAGGGLQRTDAGDGDDTIYAIGVAGSTHEGGAGNDRFILDPTEYSGNLYGGTGDRDRFDASLVLAYFYTVNLAAGTYVDDGNTFDAQGIEDATGGQLADTLIGSTLANILDGQGGNDTITGDAGNDTINGGIGNDSLNGGADSDRIDGGQNDDVIDGSTGDDNLIGSAGNDILLGDTGNDTLSGGSGNDSMAGGAGNDLFVVDSLQDIVTEVNGQGTADRINTSVSLSLQTFASFVENLTLLGISDLTGDGNALNNLLVGNSGNNAMSGNGGNDTINGGTGNDSLIGGMGNDSLVGGDGNDTLNGGVGNDAMLGGVGNDTYSVDSLGDTVAEQVGQGTADRVNTTVNVSLLALSVQVENLTLQGNSDLTGSGNSLNNVLTGNIGNNTLVGNDGNDTINSGNGNDALSGGAGNDRLNGGGDNDRLTGGADGDRFVFAATFGNDRVTDFDVAAANEFIDLSGVAAITDFADLVANYLTQVGANAVITAGADTITLAGILAANLTASEFIF